MVMVHGSSSISTFLRDGKIGSESIFIFSETTDAGSDQSSRRRQTLAAAAGCNLPNLFYLDLNCLMHQFHLCVKSMLEKTDAFVSAVQLGNWQLITCFVCVAV